MRVGDSRRDSVVIQREDLQRAPGTYLITVVSGAQVISDFSLAVQRATAGKESPELARGDRGVLQEVRSCLLARTRKLCLYSTLPVHWHPRLYSAAWSLALIIHPPAKLWKAAFHVPLSFLNYVVVISMGEERCRTSVVAQDLRGMGTASVLHGLSYGALHGRKAVSPPDLLKIYIAVGAQVMDQCCGAEGSCPQLRAAAAKERFAQFCNAVPNQCDSRGRLTHLSLMSEDLSCPFPHALNRLSALTRLDLTFNKLYGRCTSPRTTYGLLYLSHLL
jgi:hypothetical protein